MEESVKDSELIKKIYSAVCHQCQQRGYAAPADVLVDIGVLPKQKYEEYRFGKVQYLEQVCTCNLKKLSFIMGQIRACAKKNNLKPSFCYYKRWGMKKKQGHKQVIPLRFSRSGNPEIERAYATHYVDLERVDHNVSEEIVPYTVLEDKEAQMIRNAMLVYPYIKNGVMSHGKAAEMLGLHKIDLIALYGKLGLPYFDETDEEFMILFFFGTALIINESCNSCKKNDKPSCALA